MVENFIIELYNSFHIKVIGSPGKKLLTSMFLEYYDAKILETVNRKNNSVQEDSPKDHVKDSPKDHVDLCIFIGKDYETVKKYNTTPFLIGILSKKDYNFIADFCKTYNLRLYIAPTKQIYTYYKYLNFPMFDYIHLSLALSASALSKKEATDSENKDSKERNFSLSVVNVEHEFVQTNPDKPFHIRSDQNPDWKHLTFIWEPGTKVVGNKIIMEWIRNTIYESEGSDGSKDLHIHTIIDIDEIYETSDMKDYLLPFTILGIHQKSILIVNTEDLGSKSLDSEDSEPFDYHIYTNIMELWNNKHYIPKRLSLLESTALEFDTNSVKDSGYQKDPKVFELERSIKNPPIFILDNFESIYNFVSKLTKKSMILYIGKEENFRKFLKS
jgi:hypothetical protein